MHLNWLLRYPDDVDGGGDLVAEAEAAVAEEAPPEPYAIADDGQFAWDGLDAPLTGREVREGFMRQSDYTQKTQELADQRKTLETQASEADRYKQYAQQLEQALQQRLAPQPAPAEPHIDPRVAEAYAAMDNQGGIPTKREVQALINHLQENGIGGLQNDFKQHQQNLEYVLRDYVATKQQVGEINNWRQQQAVDTAISNALREAKVSDKHAEAAKAWVQDMIGSHQPDQSRGETHEQFLAAVPRMFAERWSSIVGVSRELDREDLAAAKDIPRQGGNATPSKPIKPEMDVSKILDMHPPDGGWRE